VNSALNTINIFNPYPVTKLGLGMASKVVGLTTHGLKSTGLEEKDALYNLKVEVEENLQEKFSVDDRVFFDGCNAKMVNFDVASTPQFYWADREAPSHVNFKNIVNQYGTSDKDGEDTLRLFVYSDYLKSAVRFPAFSS